MPGVMTATWGWFWILMAILAPVWVLVTYAVVGLVRETRSANGSESTSE